MPFTNVAGARINRGRRVETQLENFWFEASRPLKHALEITDDGWLELIFFVIYFTELLKKKINVQVKFWARPICPQNSLLPEKWHVCF